MTNSGQPERKDTMDATYLVAWKSENYGDVFTKCYSWSEVENVKETLTKCSKVWDIHICQIIEHVENMTDEERYKFVKCNLSSAYGMVCK